METSERETGSQQHGGPEGSAGRSPEIESVSAPEKTSGKVTVVTLLAKKAKSDLNQLPFTFFKDS